MRILVLQEIEGNRERIHLALDPLGFEIISFNSQPRALEYLVSNQVDMIISAVHLQSGNVFDFLKWVKGDSLNNTAKFVFFCAEPTELAKYVWPAVQTAALTLGADRYIAMESFNEHELRQSLADVIAKHNRKREHDRDGKDL
ncbi:MAG TPA: response regulator [Trichormus sp.]